MLKIQPQNDKEKRLYDSVDAGFTIGTKKQIVVDPVSTKKPAIVPAQLQGIF